MSSFECMKRIFQKEGIQKNIIFLKIDYSIEINVPTIIRLIFCILILLKSNFANTYLYMLIYAELVNWLQCLIKKLFKVNYFGTSKSHLFVHMFIFGFIEFHFGKNSLDANWYLEHKIKRHFLWVANGKLSNRGWWIAYLDYRHFFLTKCNQQAIFPPCLANQGAFYIIHLSTQKDLKEA